MQDILQSGNTLDLFDRLRSNSCARISIKPMDHSIDEWREKKVSALLIGMKEWKEISTSVTKSTQDSYHFLFSLFTDRRLVKN